MIKALQTFKVDSELCYAGKNAGQSAAACCYHEMMVSNRLSVPVELTVQK